jgi:hypothetical protein
MSEKTNDVVEQKIDAELVVAVKVNRIELLQQMDFTIICQADSDTANILLTKATTGLKTIEEIRNFFVRPLNNQVKAINEKFKLLTQPLADKKQQLSDSLLAWRKEEQLKLAEAEAEQRRIYEEKQAKARTEEERRRKISEAKGGDGIVKTPVEQPIYVPPVNTLAQDTTTVRKQWTFEIEDEIKVPREYLALDTVKIGQAVRAGVRDIAGVRIFQKEIPVFGR